MRSSLVRPVMTLPACLLVAAALVSGSAAVAESPVVLAQAAKPPAPIAPAVPKNVKPDAQAGLAETDAALQGRTLAEKVQRFYEKTKDFTARFEQQYRYTAMARTQKSSGTVQVKKPGLMRWDYEKPYPKQFILDGRSLWIFEPEDKSVQVQREFQADAMSSAVTFLWGRGQLTDEFRIRRVQRPDLGPAVIELTPKTPQPGFTQVFFAVDEATGAVTTSLVVDSQGNQNRITFSDVKTNQNVPDARFKFTPPKDVTVRELPKTP